MGKHHHHHGIIFAHSHKKARKHWLRRAVLLVAVLVVGIIIHKIIEDYNARYAFQSAELFLASLIDSLAGAAND